MKLREDIMSGWQLLVDRFGLFYRSTMDRFHDGYFSDGIA
jgi:hypothetical protein